MKRTCGEDNGFCVKELFHKFLKNHDIDKLSNNTASLVEQKQAVTFSCCYIN